MLAETAHAGGRFIATWQERAKRIGRRGRLAGIERMRTHWLIAASVSLLPALSLAQSSTSEREAPSDGDSTIRIVVTPPARIYIAPARMSPEEEQDADDEEDAYERDHPPSARPAPRDTPALRERAWHRRLGAAVTVGVGSPLGIAGAYIEYDPHPIVGIQLGGGAGGTFGPAIALLAIARPIRAGRFAPYVGVGASTNFTPGSYRVTGLSVPSNSWWIDFEIGGEYRSRSGLFVRLAVGHTVLLNTGEFTNQEHANFYGPVGVSNTLGSDPIQAADSHDVGRAMTFFNAHFDVGYQFAP